MTDMAQDRERSSPTCTDTSTEVDGMFHSAVLSPSELNATLISRGPTMFLAFAQSCPDLFGFAQVSSSVNSLFPTAKIVIRVSVAAQSHADLCPHVFWRTAGFHAIGRRRFTALYEPLDHPGPIAISFKLNGHAPRDRALPNHAEELVRLELRRRCASCA